MKAENSHIVKAGRRDFVRQLGTLVVGFPILSWNNPGEVIQDLKLPGSLSRHPSLDAWLEILEDNRIRVFTGKIELGQGISTVIRQVAAEELFADIEQVEVVVADTGRTPNEGYTAGSGSVKGSAMSVRYAAAFARKKLCELAAAKLGLSDDQLILQGGVVSHKSSGKQIGISEILNGQQLKTEIELPVDLVSQENYRYVGTDVRHKAMESIVAGKPWFVQDLFFDGMLHARVLRPTTFGQILPDLKPEDGKGFPLEVEVRRHGNLLAFVSEHEYQVVKAYNRVRSMISIPDSGTSHGDLRDRMAKFETENEGQLSPLENLDEQDLTWVEGSFYKPYVMHGAIGPACGVAHYDGTELTIWTHSQGVYPFRSAVSAMLDLDEENIRVIGVPGSGCFGHNSSDDAAADAAVLALLYPGKHIRVQWMREQEHAGEPYGSAMRMDVRAGLRGDGTVATWQAGIWTDSHSTRPNSDAGTLLTARHLPKPKPMSGRGYLRGGVRNAEPYYHVGMTEIQAHFFEGKQRVSSLRSLGAYANAFAIESVMDEMSMLAGMDPLDFRIKNLSDKRAIAVLEKLKATTDGMQLNDDEGLGFAFCRYKNNDAYCAVAARVKVDNHGQVEVEELWAVLDAGEVMNPDGLINQTEGGMIQAASWTLMEQVTFTSEMTTSRNWGTYPILRCPDVPMVHVDLIRPAGVPPLGGGEAATPPTPAAITNAVFRVTGKRIYDLPIGTVSLDG